MVSLPAHSVLPFSLPTSHHPLPSSSTKNAHMPRMPALLQSNTGGECTCNGLTACDSGGAFLLPALHQALSFPSFPSLSPLPTLSHSQPSHMQIACRCTPAPPTTACLMTIASPSPTAPPVPLTPTPRYHTYTHYLAPLSLLAFTLLLHSPSSSLGDGCLLTRLHADRVHWI